MAYETAKAVARRLHDSRFATRYYRGYGIDIGAGTDPLTHYASLFPGILGMIAWDKEQGDAMLMKDVPDNTFDFVNSSHCLEHLSDPHTGLSNWIRICKPGGHLVIVVPHWQLYEHGKWPSPHNDDHQTRYSIVDNKFPHDMISVVDLVGDLADQIDTLKIELLDQGYLYGAPDTFDQSAVICCEPAIEIILRKR